MPQRVKGGWTYPGGKTYKSRSAAMKAGQRKGYYRNEGKAKRRSGR